MTRPFISVRRRTIAVAARRSAEGVFWDWPGDTEVVLARKPG
jgi:hypothetical protein